MTKPLEAYIAELQEVIDGPHGKFWCHTPAVSALIAALEKSQQEKDKWVKWATELGEKSDVKDKRIAELEGYKTAYMEWSDKTDWVQKSPAGRFGFISLGMHLADVMTRHIEQLEASHLAVKLFAWVSVKTELPDPKSKWRVCAYTPTEHPDLMYRSLPASLFKAVCSDATHWCYFTSPDTVQGDE